MRDLLTAYREARSTARPMVVCRLVETRGSTPQKAGASMLVFADGSQAGTLGGGCVEAEVKRRALGALHDGAAEVAVFQLDSDYGWDDGLICGGRMQVLIDPLSTSQGETIAYYDAVMELAAQGQGLYEAIVYDAEKSGLSIPARYLFDVDHALGAASSGCDKVPQVVRDVLADSKPRAWAAHGVAVLPLRPRNRLVIVGGGHVGQAVAQWAADLDFDVCVVDDRAEYVAAERFPRAERRIAGDLERVLPELDVTDAYCLIVTRGHHHDERALALLIDRGAHYLGLIGSKRKIKLIFDDLAAEGVSAESLARVYAPVGVDIGSQTVPEIAISILAELVAHRNLDGHVPGRPPAILAEPLA